MVIGVSLDFGGSAAIQPVVDELGISFPVYWTGDKVAQEEEISEIPLILIIRKGEIVERITGKRSEKYLEERILFHLEKCGSPTDD